jgi:serine/threonine-protein kinase
MHPTFGRYELLKRLAGGGMGEVFLARHRGLGGFQKLLVLKTLLPHLCEDEEFITMFKDEARVTAQLIHPNICQVFEFEQVGGIYYMAMEYLRGEDLRRFWKACERGTPLRVPLICRVIADASPARLPTRSATTRAKSTTSSTATSLRRTSSSPSKVE